jgi:hypothetical protein
VRPHKSYKGKAMDKEHNEIGKDVVGRRNDKSKPKVLAEFSEKVNRRSRKMN